ncbi:MAG: hypothetical protein N5P05_002048 [Chroococcopsis gigantea SAG 12.99]|jgi:hypothetical protein|nr:hypothetical protein [Chlorogloea purpurea SAG 13.99]MDV3000442.1 hypothetical protein [Chroococcopsis gigantea SAG 12.99]
MRLSLLFSGQLFLWVLIAPAAIAAPYQDRNPGSFPPIKTDCSSFTPLTNTLPPTVPEAKLESSESPTSGCAEDLGEIDRPVAQDTPSPEEQTPPENVPETETTVKESEGWKIYFQPYATIPVSTYGQNTIRGRTVNYSLGLGQVLQVLQVAVSGRVEAWNGDLGLIVDGYYASLQGTGIKGARRPEVEETLQSVLTFNQGIYDFAVSYHIGEKPVPYGAGTSANFPRISFAPYVGTRLNDINSTIENTLTFPRRERIRQDSFSKGRTWFEPLVGGRLALQISEPITLWVRGDASGFGLAGETDMSWNAIFGLDWWVHRQVSLQLAYRFYEIDYGNGTGDNAFRFQQNFNGPYLGATFRF